MDSSDNTQNKSDSKTPKENTRPISSTAVHGTPWCVVWTGDGRVFFFNPSQRLSVWEKPEELKNRADVDRLLEKQPSPVVTPLNTETIKENVQPDLDVSVSKKPRL